MYGRELDGQILTLAATGWTWHDTFVLWDHETGSLWFGGIGDEGWPSLTCVEGPLQGAHLQRHDFRRTLWNRWVMEHPESKLMRRRQP